MAPTPQSPLGLFGTDALIDEDDRAIRDVVRSYVEDKVKPQLADWYEAGTIPARYLNRLSDFLFIAARTANADFPVTFQIDQDGRLRSVDISGPFYGSKGTVDYTSERATSTPLFKMQGAFTLGLDGRGRYQVRTGIRLGSTVRVRRPEGARPCPSSRSPGQWHRRHLRCRSHRHR